MNSKHLFARFFGVAAHGCNMGVVVLMFGYKASSASHTHTHSQVQKNKAHVRIKKTTKKLQPQRCPRICFAGKSSSLKFPRRRQPRHPGNANKWVKRKSGMFWMLLCENEKHQTVHNPRRLQLSQHHLALIHDELKDRAI